MLFQCIGVNIWNMWLLEKGLEEFFWRNSSLGWHSDDAQGASLNFLIRLY